MRKNVLTVGAAAMTILAATTTSPMAFAAEGESSFPTNNRGDLMITKIKPHESKLELTLNRVEDNTYYPVYAYFWNGTLPDEVMEEIPGMGDEYGSVSVLYNGLVNILTEDGLHENGESATITRSNFWGNYDFMNFEEPVFGYYILYGNSTPGMELDRPAYKGWIDYGRCVNSMAFKNGEATECWMEDLGDGTVQYQPYDEFGNRYEVVFEEDVTTDDNAVDGGDTEENGDEEGNGDEEDNGDEIVIKTVPEIREKLVYVTEYKDREIARGDGIARSAMSWFGGVAANSLEAKDEDEENKAEDEGVKRDANEKEEIEVPNLGKEVEKKSDWQMYAAIILVMAAALTGLWFIFFGKKSKKEKEGEE